MELQRLTADGDKRDNTNNYNGGDNGDFVISTLSWPGRRLTHYNFWVLVISSDAIFEDLCLITEGLNYEIGWRPQAPEKRRERFVNFDEWCADAVMCLALAKPTGSLRKWNHGRNLWKFWRGMLDILLLILFLLLSLIFCFFFSSISSFSSFLFLYATGSWNQIGY